MANDKGFKRMSDLATSLGTGMQQLVAGDLRPADLEELSEEARELYERLVVLRHKAREGRPLSAPEPSLSAAAPKGKVEETRPVIKLDTKPVNKDLAQTSLIDAIAETEFDETVNELHEEVKPDSLAEKFEQRKIEDIEKAIGLNLKFRFISELFGDDKAAYQKAIKELNEMGDLKKARAFVKHVVKNAPEPPEDDVVEELMELVERRLA